VLATQESRKYSSRAGGDRPERIMDAQTHFFQGDGTQRPTNRSQVRLAVTGQLATDLSH
jgi:hypothetical protein